MWKWLGGSPPKKKAKPMSEIRQEYEKSKRERTFQPSWLNTFKWLAFSENKMHCFVCKKHDTGATSGQAGSVGAFITGTSNFKIDVLKRHELSESHVRCMERNIASSQSGSSTAEKTLVLMNKAVSNKLNLLFRNAHYIAKNGKPYTEFVSLCHLDKAKQLDIGDTYLTDKYCQKFVASIADTRRQEQKQFVDKAPFISVISDGSTDCSSREAEIVYVRASVECKVETYFAGLKHVERGDAVHISNAISQVLDGRFEGWKQKIVAMGTDGASVMIGNKSGVVKRVADLVERPFVKSIHCSAHRLELAYKDGTKNVNLHQKCELLLLNLYLFYKYSPLNRSNLRNSFTSLGKKMLVPTRMGGTRWLPHTRRALQQVLGGYEGIVLHLEQMQENPKKESSCKAKSFLKLLKDSSVRAWLHFMLDVVKCLGAVSEGIQKKESTVADIFSELASAKITLEKYKTSYGSHLRGWVATQPENAEECISTRRKQLLTSLLNAISIRFDGDGVLFASSNSLLSVSAWPRFTDNIEFGDEHIGNLVDIASPAISASCPTADVNNIELEWTRLKTDLAQRNDKLLSWTQLEEGYGQKYSNFFLLVNYLLTLPGSSVDAERGFSCLKMVKSDWRSRLGDINLSDQMMVTMEVEDVGQWDPMPAIKHWFNGGDRARRPYYKDDMRKCNLPRINVAPVPDADGIDDVDSQLEQEVDNNYMEPQTDLNESQSDSEGEEEFMMRKDLLALQNKTYEILKDIMNN